MRTSPAWQPLSKRRHGECFWRPARGYQHAAGRGLAPLTHRELGRAVGAFPLAFHGDPPRLVAVLGLSPERSAFVDERGRWRGRYVPAQLRAYPFGLGGQGSGRYWVAVDTAAEALQADRYTGDPLFTPEGAPSEAFQPRYDFLCKLAQARLATDRACQALAEHGLLSAWQPRLRVGGQRRQLTGLLTVDEQRLHACSGEALAALQEAGALAIAYGQLLSQSQLRTLAQQAEAREREAQIPGAEAIFGEAPLEERIDWDALDNLGSGDGDEGPDT